MATLNDSRRQSVESIRGEPIAPPFQNHATDSRMGNVGMTDDEKDRLAWATSRLPAELRQNNVVYLHLVGGLSVESAARLARASVELAAAEIQAAELLLPGLLALNPLPRPRQIPALGFRALVSPAAMAAGRSDAQPCAACGKIGLGYHALECDATGRLWNNHYVCEFCTRAGRVEALGLSFNEVDRAQLDTTLARVNPDLASSERSIRTESLSREIIFCTPRPPILQPFLWPAHCGEYLGFVAQVSTDDLCALSPDGDGIQLFRDRLLTAEPPDEEWILGSWEYGFAPKGFTHVYLWRCLVCGEPFLTSDNE